MTQVEVTVPAYALVNNPIPVSINLPKGGARIRMQVIYEEEVIYESVYNILKSIKIDISDILQTIVSVKDRDMTEISFCDDSEQQCEYEIKFTELFNLLFVDGNPAGVKSMLNAMGMIENKLRLPLVPTRITTFEAIRKVLNELNIKC